MGAPGMPHVLVKQYTSYAGQQNRAVINFHVFIAFVMKSASRKSATKLLFYVRALLSISLSLPLRRTVVNLHPCAPSLISSTYRSNNMCLSGFCGESGQCEFSTRQAVVIGVTLVCFGILLMAASSPPSYKELHPEADARTGGEKRRKVYVLLLLV